MRVLINAQMLPGGLAGGTEQFLMGLVYGLGRASDGPEEYILIGHWKDPEWLQPIPGSKPKDRLGEARPPRAFEGDPWTIMAPRPSSAAHGAKLGFWSTLFHWWSPIQTVSTSPSAQR